MLVWDGEGAIGRWRSGKAELTGDCQAFRGTLGTRVIVCKPADPEAKGLVERFHDYLERSFLPGRDFAGPADFNAQLRPVAGGGQHPRPAGAGLLGGGADRRRQAGDAHPAAGRPGHRVAVVTRLARDHYIRLDSNDYSVHPAVIGRRIEVTADLDRVTVACEGRVVAGHERIWAWHQTMSDPEHLAAARVLRRDRIAIVRPPREAEVQIRCLADYDTALGLQPGRDGGVMTAAKTASRDTGRRGRVPDPGAESPGAARVGVPARRPGPGRVVEP